MTAQDPDTNRNDNIATPFVSGQFSFSDKPIPSFKNVDHVCLLNPLRQNYDILMYFLPYRLEF